jgi:hypothetical protein
MQVNRGYTPGAMLATASAITGKEFRRGQYEKAAQALQDWIDRQGPVVGPSEGTGEGTGKR